ncbi:MAG TPA: hypothetical protein VEK34_06715 [Methylocella sp.]|nr:hypothetical protein [Methylocella sp.]
MVKLMQERWSLTRLKIAIILAWLLEVSVAITHGESVITQNDQIVRPSDSRMVNANT